MAMQDSPNLVTYPTMGQPGSMGPMATSTKVLNLSRAQANFEQPNVGQQTYYAQSAAQVPLSQQPMNHAGSFQPAPSDHFTPMHQRFNQPQPQIYTVGANQPMQPQQFRVITTPQQPGVNQNRTIIHPPVPPTNYNAQQNTAYFGQQQPVSPQTQQYVSYSQPQQPQQHQYQQPVGQVVFAQPATFTKTPGAQPSTFQGQPAMVSGQTGSVVLPANQQSMRSQPMGMQSSQQWVTTAPATYDQAYQQPQVGSTGSWSSQSQTQFAPATDQQTGGSFYQRGSAFHQQPQTPTQTISSGGHQFGSQSQVSVISHESQPRVYQQPREQQYQPAHQTRPPLPHTQQDNQQIRRRTPSVAGAERTIKVKSLPMRNSTSIDAINVATGPPQFIQHPVAQVTVNEGDPVTVSACVRPAGDSTLSVEWFKNGKPIAASSRLSTIFDRGHVVLEFSYTNEDDTGDYSCVATNSCGQDQSSGCRVTVIPEDKVVTDTQLPEESMVANLAAMENHMLQNGFARGTRYADEPKVTQPPHFMKPLIPQTGLREAAPAHFETIIEPANDASLTVDWYKDGKPVSMGCRFNSVFDRGFAVLDILYCYPEDNGAYWCVAKNAVGQVQSNVVELQCNQEASIVTNSVLSKESISYLQSLDDWGSETMAGYDRPQIFEDEPASAPTFDVLPTALTVTEGSPAKFMVKASGFPRPKFQWFIDGEVLASHGGGGNWSIYQDGGISHLEFHRVGNPGQQHIRVVARNNMGEVAVDTTLTIEPQQDYRPDLRHVQPDNPFKKLAQLKKVERSQELTSALSRPKAQALDLRRIERQSEYKGRSAADAESIEAENLYSRVQSQLRTSRRSSLQSPIPPQPRPQAVNQPHQPQPHTRSPGQPPDQPFYQQREAPLKPGPPPVQANLPSLPTTVSAPVPSRPPAPMAPPPPPPQPTSAPTMMNAVAANQPESAGNAA